MIEFVLLGIPVIFITTSIIAVSIDMWEFFTLAWATETTARYITSHGAGCGTPNSCTITVGGIATLFAAQAIALDPGKVIVTLTDGSGDTTCNPLSSCTSNATTFPSTSSNYNSVGSDVKVKATYILKNPLALYWPPDVDHAGDFTVGALSRQRIVF